jgi:hypothetical protein
MRPKEGRVMRHKIYLLLGAMLGCGIAISACGVSNPIALVPAQSAQPPSHLSSPAAALVVCRDVGAVVKGVNEEGWNYFFDSNMADQLGNLNDASQAYGAPFYGLESIFAAENVAQDYPDQLKTLSLMVAACGQLGDHVVAVDPSDINDD